MSALKQTQNQQETDFKIVSIKKGMSAMRGEAHLLFYRILLQGVLIDSCPTLAESGAQASLLLLSYWYSEK